MIAVVDYKAGNLTSVMKALRAVGAEALLSDEPEVVAKAGKIILPGVGHFSATRYLRDRGLEQVIRERVESGAPHKILQHLPACGRGLLRMKLNTHHVIPFDRCREWLAVLGNRDGAIDNRRAIGVREIHKCVLRNTGKQPRTFTYLKRIPAYVRNLQIPRAESVANPFESIQTLHFRSLPTASKQPLESHADAQKRRS